MTTIDQLVDVPDMEREIAEGYLNRRFHPDDPDLATVGYSDKCQFDNHWTGTTRALRGVIYRVSTGEVLARPFAKFFNYGQESGAQYALYVPLFWVDEKHDGSLGIVYQGPDDIAVATRGSFESEQALHATALLRAQKERMAVYANMLQAGQTPLVEIIYPENRIVLDYGDRDELIDLGTVSIQEGRFAPPRDEAPAHTSLHSLLADVHRPNAEGWVAWIDPWTAVKIKQEDYIALHRIVSSLTEKEVWRQMMAGTIGEFMEALPDEFHDWARDAQRDILKRREKVEFAVQGAYRKVMKGLPRGLDPSSPEYRKEFALLATQTNWSRFLFAYLDRRDTSEMFWKAVEPKGT